MRLFVRLWTAGTVCAVALSCGLVVVTGAGAAGRGGAAVGGAGAVARREAAPVWRPPLDGTPVVTRRFDPPARPWLAGHRGVDLAGRPGVPVRAAGPGVIHYAGTLAGRGVVSVAHGGGLRTTYEPVTADVAAGDQVPAGGIIGRLAAGHPGCPVAACLHWGLRTDAGYLDPLLLLGLGRARLLPVAPAPPRNRGPRRLAPPGGPHGAGGAARVHRKVEPSSERRRAP